MIAPFRLSPSLAGVCLVLALTPLVCAEELHPATQPSATQTQSDSMPVFHARTRVVLVDVIVSDKKGQFLPDLKSEDFTVLEDGKPQHISGFSVGRYEPPRTLPPLQLPPNQYTNFTQKEPGGAVTIVILDGLNSPFLEQVYARQAVLKFFEKLPPGQRIALFVLSDKPRLVQGFTGSSDTLTTAAKAVKISHQPPLTTEVGDTGIADSQNAAGPVIQAVQEAFDSGIATEKAIAAEMRMRLTLASLQWIARAVSGYPGRKNLLWLSGQFPFRLSPEFTMNNRAGAIGSHMPEVLETAALLASAQVAVYPIDATGLSTNLSLDSRYGTSSQALGQTTAGSWDKESAMEDIARETGGKAFYGSNAVDESLQHGIQQGSDYYTLAYSPENHNWNGGYRKIEVKVASKSVKITFRRGYYAREEKEFTGDQAAKMLATAVQPTTPLASMLLFKAQVLPPDSEHKTVRIDYAVDAHDINFSDTPDKLKHAAVDFMAVAWDKDFKDAGYETDTVASDFKPETYEQFMKTGFPVHQELDLKPGRYTLRLGVIDRGSQKVGTLDIPLIIDANVAAKN